MDEPFINNISGSVDQFIEGTLIVEGALEETQLFSEESELTNWITELQSEHKRVHAETEWQVFVLRHQHSPYQECECQQYETSHKPHAVIGAQA